MSRKNLFQYHVHPSSPSFVSLQELKSLRRSLSSFLSRSIEKLRDGIAEQLEGNSPDPGLFYCVVILFTKAPLLVIIVLTLALVLLALASRGKWPKPDGLSGQTACSGPPD